MKWLLMCGLVLGMLWADAISSMSQVQLMRYAVCYRVKVIRGIRVLKCERPIPLADPTENVQTFCDGVGSEFNSLKEARHWMRNHCN
jgi:hypothetical protein